MSFITEAILLYSLLFAASLFFASGGLKKLRKSLTYLGLIERKFFLTTTLKQAAALILTLFIALTLEAIVLNLFLPGDSEKVAIAISTFSIYAIIISLTIAPFAEEVFFRGLLQKRIGIVLAALVFALLHFSFGSVTELVGAFTAGIILGWWVKYRNPSLWPAIIAHSAYNAISILLVFA